APCKSGRKADVQALRRLLADLALARVEDDRELARRLVHGAHLDFRPGHVALVVEPVQEVAVVLGEPDDLSRLARGELGEREHALGLSLPALRVARSAPRAGSARTPWRSATRAGSGRAGRGARRGGRSSRP